MTVIASDGAFPLPATSRKILFVAAALVDIASILRPPLADFEVVRARGMAETVALVISGGFSHVVVDQTEQDQALELLVPLLASSDHDFKLYIIAAREDVGKYLRVRGVDRVFEGSSAEVQIRKALGASAPPQAEFPSAPVDARIPAATDATPVIGPLSLLVEFRNRATSVISALYKNAAFALLAILFAAFCFYGLLIGYFLVSSGWGAPVTLSRGHELVSRVEQQLSDMRVNANLTSQRHSEAQLEASEAERARADADVLVGYVMSTIDGEIAARTAKRTTMTAAIRRQKKLQNTFKQELGKTGLSAKLSRLYAKRVIDRKTLESNTLGILEAGQRMSMIENELAIAGDDVASFDASLRMLEILKLHLRTGKGQLPSAASADLLLLTKQAVDARSALDQSEVQLASAQSRLKLLDNSTALLQQRIAEVEASPLGRAVQQRVDVIFVPYGNERGFVPQAPLYSCAFTFIICHRVGEVGERLPGEANAVHPFFGKPIRGYFVEAKLSESDAASEEIIHAGRPPLFF